MYVNTQSPEHFLNKNRELKLVNILLETLCTHLLGFHLLGIISSNIVVQHNQYKHQYSQYVCKQRQLYVRYHGNVMDHVMQAL